MIPGSALYNVVEAMAPLYTAAALGYASVRWLGAFSDEQCAGISHFVTLYALPLLIFHMVSTNDPYHMDGRLLAADTLQKALVLLVLLAAWRASRGGVVVAGKKPAPLTMKWVVSGFSVATLPNTIIVGVPLLRGMYGEPSTGVMKQIVVPQFGFWYIVVIFLYEFMAAGEAIGAAAKVSPAEHTRRRDQVAVEITEVVAVATTAAGDAGDDKIENDELMSGDGGDVDVTTVEEVVVPARQAPLVMHVVWKAGKRFLKAPNTYASILGLIWSLVAFKAGIKMPKIVDASLSIIYTTAVGLSMFASGTFIARQPRFVACGYKIALLSMVLRFLIGPVAMLLASLAVGLHGALLHVAVVQAALPLAIASFVYAEEYKVHADIMSTGVILGTFISLPVTIVYYILLGLS